MQEFHPELTENFPKLSKANIRDKITDSIFKGSGRKAYESLKNRCKGNSAEFLNELGTPIIKHTSHDVSSVFKIFLDVIS